LALDDHQLRRSALLGGALRPRRLRLPGRPGGPGLGRARGRPRRGLRAEQVGPDHADGRDDEQPQHREERQLDQREGEWGHRSRGYSLSRRKTSVVRPIVTREPSTSVTRRIGCPFTNEPLVDPRSTRATSGPSTRISAWCRATPGSTSRRSQSVPRPSNVPGVMISYVRCVASDPSTADVTGSRGLPAKTPPRAPCGTSLTGWRISPPSTVEPLITPDLIRNMPVARSPAFSNRTRTGPTKEYPCSFAYSRARFASSWLKLSAYT